MSQWKVGDEVQLKSGGPIMTVTGMGDNLGKPLVWCSWFAGKEPKSSTFPPEALKPYRGV